MKYTIINKFNKYEFDEINEIRLADWKYNIFDTRRDYKSFGKYELFIINNIYEVFITPNTRLNNELTSPSTFINDVLYFQKKNK